VKRVTPCARVLLVAFLIVATLAQRQSASPVATYWPTHGWRSSTGIIYLCTVSEVMGKEHYPRECFSSQRHAS
jgi:hypothetical protein